MCTYIYIYREREREILYNLGRAQMRMWYSWYPQHASDLGGHSRQWYCGSRRLCSLAAGHCSRQPLGDCSSLLAAKTIQSTGDIDMICAILCYTIIYYNVLHYTILYYMFRLSISLSIYIYIYVYIYVYIYTYISIWYVLLRCLSSAASSGLCRSAMYCSRSVLGQEAIGVLC